MKSLLALLLIGLGLGFGFWKTQFPDSTVDDLTINAGESVNRIKGGLTTVFDGGASELATNQRIDALEAKLLESQSVANQTAVNARMDSLEAGIVAAQQAADPSVINGRMTDTERRIAATEAKMARFSAEMDASISTTSNDTEAQLTALNNRLDLINRRIEEQAQQHDSEGFGTALSALEAEIATIQENQRRVEDSRQLELSGIDEKLGGFEARFNTLSADASDGQAEAIDSISVQIDQRLAALEDKLETTNSDSLRLESMSNELSASRVRLQAMEQSVNDANEQLTELAAQLANLKTQSESSSIDGKQAELRTQLSQLQDQMSRSGGGTDVEELTTALQATRDRIETLEQRVIDLPATSSGADEVTKAQSDLQAQIEALEAKLSQVQTEPDATLVDSITQVEEKVSELASKSYVTQEELRKQQQSKSIEYKIYFEPDSTEITEDAGIVLNSFIAQEKNRTTGVSIFGFTDRIGSASYNQALALQRATNVRSYLIQNGFSYTKIKSLSGLGEDAAANLPDGEEDAQQRSVVLYAQQP